MQVIKRNGSKIDFNPNKILMRIKKQSEGLKVNADEVFIKVTQGIADNMTTNELDDLISVVSESLAMNHPDYSKLAANIAITKLHKETEDSFMKATKKLYNAGLLNDFYYNSEGKMVMTEEYHKLRGSCCGSKCLHCAFYPQHIKGNKTLKSQH